MKMTSVKTRLPEKDGQYLVCLENIFYRECKWEKGKWNTLSAHNAVTHWCELPELEEEPKQELKKLVTDEEFIFMKSVHDDKEFAMKSFNIDRTNHLQLTMGTVAFHILYRIAEEERDG